MNFWKSLANRLLDKTKSFRPTHLAWAPLALILLIPSSHASQSVTLAWDANSEPDIVSYTVYYGLASGVYTFSLPVGNQTSVTISDLLDSTTYYFVVTATNDSGLESDPSNEVSFQTPAPAATVAGKFLFYNNSDWDNNNASADSADDDAIAPSKVALLPGGVATFANYSSFSRGINGVMIDILGLPALPTLSDFSFKVGNSDTPAAWTTAPNPLSITVRQGAGVAGADRVTLVWADNNLDAVADPNEAVAKSWLEITVKATANTGLALDDVFYFGNAVGDTGNSAADARVNILDENGARTNPRNFLNLASLDDPYDFNRDRKVNIFDEHLARICGSNFLTALKLIAPPGGAGLASIAHTAGTGTPANPSRGMMGLASRAAETTAETTPAAEGSPAQIDSSAEWAPALRLQQTGDGLLVLEVAADRLDGLTVQWSSDLSQDVWNAFSLATAEEVDDHVWQWILPHDPSQPYRFFRAVQLNNSFLAGGQAF